MGGRRGVSGDVGACVECVAAAPPRRSGGAVGRGSFPRPQRARPRVHSSGDLRDALPLPRGGSGPSVARGRERHQRWARWNSRPVRRSPVACGSVVAMSHTAIPGGCTGILGGRPRSQLQRSGSQVRGRWQASVGLKIAATRSRARRQKRRPPRSPGRGRLVPRARTYSRRSAGGAVLSRRPDFAPAHLAGQNPIEGRGDPGERAQAQNGVVAGKAVLEVAAALEQRCDD